MSRILLLPLVVLLAAVATAQTRTEFEREHLACVTNAVYMRHYSHAPDEARYDRKGGMAQYVFVLSQGGTTRARFIRATVTDGAFVSGQMFVYGENPRYVTMEEFESLRETQPMVAILLDGAKRPYASLYPSRAFERPRAYPQSINMTAESPRARMIGALSARFKLRYDVFCCDVTYTGADGFVLELGHPAKSGDSISVDTVIAKYRAAVAAKNPDRAGKISEAEVRDWSKTCKITYTPISNFYGNY